MNKTIVLLAILFVHTYAAQNVCQILALQSGGDLGSFEVGAIKGLVNTLPAQEVEYEVLSGVSVGSINALGLSMFKLGQEELMADDMIVFWQNVTAPAIYTNYKGGVAQGLLFERGLFDTGPERRLLTANLQTPPQRELNIGACNLRTGNLDLYDETLSLPNLVSLSMASSAVPGIFPYQEFMGEIYVDGGTVQLINYKGAIDKCRNNVDSDSQIIIDSIFVQYALEVSDWSANQRKKPYEVYSRSEQITNYFSTYRELLEAKQYSPNVNFRHTIKPLSALPNAKMPFFFNHATIETLIIQGISDSEVILGSETNSTQEFETESLNVVLKQWNRKTNESNRQNLKKRIVDRVSYYQKLVNSM